MSECASEWKLLEVIMLTEFGFWGNLGAVKAA